MHTINREEWETFLSRHPDAHLLQTSQWGELKSAFGWEAVPITFERAGAQVLFRKLPLGFTLAYIPKGPVGENPDQLWPLVDQLCREKRALFLKVEPDLWGEINGESRDDLPPNFIQSQGVIQPPRTLVVDLRGDEDQIFARMKQKTRYNIRLALRKGVVVRKSSDLEAFGALMAVTGERAQFGVHSIEYYRKAYELFNPRGVCELFVAEFEREPLAAIMVFARGERAWYFYGASSNIHRNFMPTYLLQWEAMRWARSLGCTEYDLWGVPDASHQILEDNFTSRTDGLWGVYRFKRGFGGQLRRAAGPWDRVYYKPLYKVYSWLAGRGSQ